MLTILPQVRVSPESLAQARQVGWARRLGRVVRRIRRLGPPTKEQRALLSGASDGTRQQKRARAFEEAFADVCRTYGGGQGWTRGQCELRRARRRIARAWAKRYFREGLEGGGG